MRLTLTYFDQNEDFGALLPRSGTVERFVYSINGSDWALFRLDSPLSYQNSAHGWLLLKSRWHDHPIGTEQPTSVFVLLVRDIADVRDGMAIDRSDLVVWATAQTDAQPRREGVE